MILAHGQLNEMLNAAKPLIKWMNENCHPNFEAVVNQTSVELLEGIAMNRTEEFLIDEPKD